MSKVYSILLSGLLLSGLSGYIASFGIISEILIYSGLFLSVIFESIYLFTKQNKFAKDVLSPISFYLSTICIGALFGSVFIGLSEEDSVDLVDLKRIMISAFIISASIFVSASIFAILSLRRLVVYLGCIISSLTLSLVGLFIVGGPMSAIFGLIIGVLYVVIDTQLMINKFENGISEPYEDARNLFYNFVKIFIEILKLLKALEKLK